MEIPRDPRATLHEAEREANKLAEEIGHQNGDLHDEDSGVYFGNLTWPSDSPDQEDKEMKLPPAKLSIYIDGYWYVYSMHARYKEGETNGKEEG